MQTKQRIKLGFFKYWRLRFKSFRQTWPYIKQFGWRYWYDAAYRAKCRKKRWNKKNRKKYGGNWSRDSALKKKRLFKRDGNMCKWCNKPMKFKDASRDHRKALLEGGTSREDNLQLMHIWCNTEKGNLLFKQHYDKTRSKTSD